MINHIHNGIYVADKETRLNTWEGAIVSTDRLLDHQPALLLNCPDQITSEDICRATAFIHAHRPVVVYSETSNGHAALFIIAYLVEYTGMRLEDAYTMLANRTYLFNPPKNWMRLLISLYDLAYTPEQVEDSYFFSKLLAASNTSIHHIHKGVYLSSMEAMRKPDRVRDLGIKAVLRVDDTERTYGQWSPEFTVLDMPIIDGVYVVKEMVQQATKFIHEQVTCNQKVLVHCHAGVSRSVTMVLAYLIEYENMSLAQAFQLVSHRRPMAYPHRALILALVEHYNLPYDPRDIMSMGFLENLMVEAEYK